MTDSSEEHSPRGPEGDAVPENVRAISSEVQFTFEKYEPDSEDRVFHVDMERWTIGKSEVIKTYPVDGDYEDGLTLLRNIGHSWRYDSTHQGYLRDQNGEEYAILHIFTNTYRVDRCGREQS